jgi:putative flippase GtrA
VTAPGPVAGEHCFMVLAYKNSPFLEGCIRTLQAQTTPSRIVVATSTPCESIARTVAETGVELVINPERAGIAGDWNFALRSAPARFVTLAHQDDTYEPGFLATTLALFERHGDGALCFTGYQEIDDAGAPKSSKISRVKHLIEAFTIGRRTLVRGLPLRLFLSFGNPLPCSSVTFDRQALADFTFSDAYASNLDWEAWWRLYSQGRSFLHAPPRLVGRRHNALTETSRLIQDGRRQAEDAQMFAKIWPRPLDRAIGALYAASYRDLVLINNILRFGLVGGGVTGLVYLVFMGLLKLGLPYLIAATIGWATGVGISYVFNRSFTFAVASKAKPKEFGAFVGGYLLQLGLGLFLYWVLMGVLGLNATVAFVLNVGFTAVFSFVFMRWVVFRRTHTAVEDVF